jgi:hypothetical protein
MSATILPKLPVPKDPFPSPNVLGYKHSFVLVVPPQLEMERAFIR